MTNREKILDIARKGALKKSGITYAEIAEQVSCPAPSVRRTINEAWFPYGEQTISNGVYPQMYLKKVTDGSLKYSTFLANNGEIVLKAYRGLAKDWI